LTPIKPLRQFVHGTSLQKSPGVGSCWFSLRRFATEGQPRSGILADIAANHRDLLSG